MLLCISHVPACIGLACMQVSEARTDMQRLESKIHAMEKQLLTGGVKIEESPEFHAAVQEIEVCVVLCCVVLCCCSHLYIFSYNAHVFSHTYTCTRPFICNGQHRLESEYSQRYEELEREREALSRMKLELERERTMLERTKSKFSTVSKASNASSNSG